jgi:hypothetical protein
MRPEPPQGVYSITGDNAVYIYWNGPYERDIKEYIIKRSFDPLTNYQEIGRRPAEDNPDLDLIIYEYVDNTAQNGVTYYYAVSSVDYAGQESELSAEEVFDTPRPEGNVALFDMAVEPSLSGYNFAARSVVAYDSPGADVYVDRVDGVFYLNVGNVNTDIQDMGFHESFDEVGWAPQDGWSSVGYFEIIPGHIYVIWTDDLHYAKLWVVSVNSSSVSFRWAYQTDAENPELAPGVGETGKPQHGPDYLKKPGAVVTPDK